MANVVLRPLPQEFGLRMFIVPESSSIIFIAGWEFSNTIRMKEKAIREGGIAINTSISVRTQIKGTKVVGTGGRSYTTILEKGKDISFPGEIDFGIKLIKEEEKEKISNNNGELERDKEILEREFDEALYTSPGELKGEILTLKILYDLGLVSDEFAKAKIKKIKSQIIQYVNLYA